MDTEEKIPDIVSGVLRSGSILPKKEIGVGNGEGHLEEEGENERDRKMKFGEEREG